MALNYKKMVKEIDNLVNGDFIADMECRLRLHEKPGIFTQEEAQEMAAILNNVYAISHCLWCNACSGKYKVTKCVQVKPNQTLKNTKKVYKLKKKNG